MPRFRSVTILAALGVALGCSGATPGPTPPPPPPPPAPVTSVTISLARTDIGLGETTQASAALKGPANQPLSGRTIAWSSSATAIATVNGGGLVTAISAGSADISATSEGISGSATLHVFAGQPNLVLANLTLTQVVQRWDGSVPLVAGGLPVLASVFGTLDRPYPAGSVPVVKLELLNGATAVLTSELPMNRTATATVDQSAPLHQVVLPASIVQPGLRVRVTINPAGVLPEATASDNVWPAGGGTAPVLVQQVPPLPLHFLPILLTVGGSVPDLTPLNLAEYLNATRQLHPISTVNADIGGLFSSDVDFGGGLAPAWLSILQQVDLLRVMEGSASYYIGALRPPPGITFVQFGGYGYIPVNPASTGPNTRSAVVVGVGWFNRARQSTELVAHELAHTMGRQHAACGNPAAPDPNYPYPAGTIGVVGYDLFSWSQSGIGLPAQFFAGAPDIMSYCNPPWISDYNYSGLLAVRGGPVAVAAQAPGSCPCLIVWGTVGEDEAVRLEPSFVAPPPTRPTPSDGSWSLRGTDAAANPLFSVAFEPSVIDHAPGVRQFTVAVPLSDAQGLTLARVEVGRSGRREAMQLIDQAGGSLATVVQRAANGTVTLRWDPAEQPLLVVRDPGRGRVLGIGKRGVLTIPGAPGELELIGPGARLGAALRVRP